MRCMVYLNIVNWVELIRMTFLSTHGTRILLLVYFFLFTFFTVQLHTQCQQNI